METTLTYREPALRWEEALPLGSGALGAMLFGGRDEELLELNEDSLWSGFPRDDVNYEARRYLERVRAATASGRQAEAQGIIEAHMLGRDPEAFQPLGSLSMRAIGGYDGAERGYSRELDIETGIASVLSSCGKRSERRQCFASAADRVIAYRWESLSGALPDIEVGLSSPHPGKIESIAPGGILLSGRLPSHVAANYSNDHPEGVLYEKDRGIEFIAQVRISNEGGTVRPAENGGAACLRVLGARSFTLLLDAASNFRAWDKAPIPGDAAPARACSAVLESALALGWEELKNRQVREHRSYFDRVSLDLGPSGTPPSADTADRLAAYRSGASDPGLESLAFQHGRYLLIACSRPGSQAANLQGVWNRHVRPPWFSDYTLNINALMNYWPAENCALGECHESLIEMIRELAVSGERTARIHYGCRGWTAHHNSDIWRMSVPALGDASWAFWPMGGAALARHAWERFAYGGDEAYLRETAWPILRGTALFIVDWLVPDRDGALGTNPSTSPENRYEDGGEKPCAICESSAMDLSIARETLEIALEAADALQIRDAETAAIDTALGRLRRPKIGSDGRVLEWGKEVPETESGHRHFSHLYALYPGGSAFGRDPEFMRACRKSLDARIAAGAGQTGWSAAWAACLYARLDDGEAAYSMVRRLISRSMHPNMFGDHPPFQIDANFGLTAAIAEMLVQSHSGEIRLLPALPKAWLSGRAVGLRARGGFSVDMEWKDGQLRRTKLLALKGGTAVVAYRKTVTELRLRAGESVELGLDLGKERGDEAP